MLENLNKIKLKILYFRRKLLTICRYAGAIGSMLIWTIKRSTVGCGPLHPSLESTALYPKPTPVHQPWLAFEHILAETVGTREKINLYYDENTLSWFLQRVFLGLDEWPFYLKQKLILDLLLTLLLWTRMNLYDTCCKYVLLAVIFCLPLISDVYCTAILTGLLKRMAAMNILV